MREVKIMFEVSFYGDDIIKVRGAYRHEFSTYKEAEAFMYSAHAEAHAAGAYEIAITCRDETIWTEIEGE